MTTNFKEFRTNSEPFGRRLEDIQAQNPAIPWYPYGSMANLQHLEPMIDPIDFLFAGGQRIADIGAADGHLAFCLEHAGNSCDIYDNAPTNFNGLRGAKAFRDALGSKVNIHEVDLDQQFAMEGQYDLIIFLGILYHLKNPYYAMERLAQHTQYLILSTRIARSFTRYGADMSEVSAAYLVSPTEANNDATNYWMFTKAGLERLCDRTGWDILSWRQLGDTLMSNPMDNDRDERAFAILKRR